MSPTRPAYVLTRLLSLSTLLLMAGALALSACGGGESSDHAAYYGRLTYKAGGEERPDPKPKLTLRIEVPDEFSEEDENLRVKATVIKVYRAEKLGHLEDVNVLHLQSADQMRIGLRRPPLAQSFNQIAVTLVASSDTDLSILVRERGAKRPLFKTNRLRVPPGKKPRTVIVDLPGLRAAKGKLAEVAILLNPRRTSVRLIAIDLLHRPWATWLPDPEDGPELVTIGSDSRLAVGISTSRSAITTFEARAGGRLDFSFSVPPELRGEMDDSRLIVKIAGTQAASFPLPVDEGDGWISGSIAVEASPGTQVTAEFVLEGDQRALCAIAEVAQAVRGAQPRTVVLVTSDTHRADYVGHANLGVEVSTPFLDKMAARGLRFEHAVSASNITNPSHVTIMTGTHLRDTGIINNHTLLSDAAPTLAEAFAAAGYRTYASISAQHLSPEHSGLGQGFDRVSPCLGTQRDSFQAIRELDNWMADAEGTPLFIWLHIFDAHAPYKVPEKWRFLYYPEDADPSSEEFPEPLDDQIPKWGGEVRDTEYFIAQYKSEISYLDAQLQAFLEQPRFDEAVIAVTSDHGESLDEHGIYWDHRELYPETLDVPLILNFPGARQGIALQQKIQLTDLGRTLLDLAGLAGSEFPGINLLGITPQSEASTRARYFIAASGLSAAISADHWFLVLHLKAHKFSPLREERERYEVELYDLRGDRRCEKNLVATEHQTAKRLRTQLIEWLESGREQTWASSSGNVQSAAAAEALKELGYTNASDEEGSSTSKAHKWIDHEYSSDWITRYE